MVKKLPVEERAVAIDLKAEKLRIENKIIKKKYQQSLKDNRKLESLLGACETDHLKTFEIRIAKGSNNEATAFIILSDWHVDEIVTAVSVNGYNRYNEKIAHSRITKVFQNALKLIEISKQDNVVKDAIIILAGDFLSGSIHEELLENTSMLPMDAMLFAQDHIASGIKFLLDNTDLNIKAVCSVGNHSRTTDKVHISTEHGNSLEYYMYHNLARFFALNKRVTFQMDKSYHQYFKVYGDVMRTHHGHAVGFGGGVGGITIPINKKIAQWDKMRQAKLDIFGHFHQWLDGGKWIVNNSLIGFSPYALKLGANPSPPGQGFFLYHAKYGKTMVSPISVE